MDVEFVARKGERREAFADFEYPYHRVAPVFGSTVRHNAAIDDVDHPKLTDCSPRIHGRFLMKIEIAPAVRHFHQEEHILGRGMPVTPFSRVERYDGKIRFGLGMRIDDHRQLHSDRSAPSQSPGQ